MTEAEKNEIVGLVMTEISSQAVDFDITTEQPKANDLLTAVRQTSSGVYEGVTLKWNDVARIATELANQAATRAEQAKTNVENMKSSVEQTVTDFNALAEEKKQEVQGVYQSDLNELKGDLDELEEEIYNSQIIDDGWEIGTFDTTWGVKYDTTLRARLENVQDKCNRFSTPSNFSIVIFGYKPNGEYVGIWNGTVFEKTYKPISGGIVNIENILKDYSGYSINIAIGNGNTLTDTHTISDNVVFYNSKIQQIEINKNDLDELRSNIVEIINLTSDRENVFEILKDTIINGNGFVIDLGTHLTANNTNTPNVYLIPYSYNVGDSIHKVFVTKELPVLNGNQELSVGYNCTLWITFADRINNRKLTPVLEYNEMLNNDETFYYEDGHIWIHTTSSDFIDFVLCEKTGMMLDGINIEINDLTIRYAKDACLNLINNASVKANNCKFEFSATGSNVSIYDSNGFFVGCESFRARYDGWGITTSDNGKSYTSFIDCKGYYCYDDGISHHNKDCEFIISGGEYHHNGKGGVSSPTYGSIGQINNVYSHDNTYGVYAISNSRVNEPLIMNGCLLRNNMQNMVAKNIDVIMNKCTSVDYTHWADEVISGGTLTKYD